MMSFQDIINKTMWAFGSDADSMVFTGIIHEDIESARILLIDRIYLMLQNDYTGLINALYRVDINEDSIKRALSEPSLKNAAGALTHEVLTRQIGKLNLPD